jgi:hypothetical protein
LAKAKAVATNNNVDNNHKLNFTLIATSSSQLWHPHALICRAAQQRILPHQNARIRVCVCMPVNSATVQNYMPSHTRGDGHSQRAACVVMCTSYETVCGACEEVRAECCARAHMTQRQHAARHKKTTKMKSLRVGWWWWWVRASTTAATWC